MNTTLSKGREASSDLIAFRPHMLYQLEIGHSHNENYPNFIRSLHKLEKYPISSAFMGVKIRISKHLAPSNGDALTGFETKEACSSALNLHTSSTSPQGLQRK